MDLCTKVCHCDDKIACPMDLCTKVCHCDDKTACPMDLCTKVCHCDDKIACPMDCNKRYLCDNKIHRCMSYGPLHKSLSLRRQNQHVLWTANKHACPLDCIHVQLSFGQQLSMSQDCYNKQCMSVGPLHSNQSQSPGRQQLLGHSCGLTNNPPRGTVTHVCHGAICATLDAAFCVQHSTALHAVLPRTCLSVRHIQYVTLH